MNHWHVKTKSYENEEGEVRTEVHLKYGRWILIRREIDPDFNNSGAKQKALSGDPEKELRRTAAEFTKRKYQPTSRCAGRILAKKVTQQPLFLDEDTPDSQD